MDLRDLILSGTAGRSLGPPSRVAFGAFRVWVSVLSESAIAVRPSQSLSAPRDSRPYPIEISGNFQLSVGSGRCYPSPRGQLCVGCPERDSKTRLAGDLVARATMARLKLFRLQPILVFSGYRRSRKAAVIRGRDLT